VEREKKKIAEGLTGKDDATKILNATDARLSRIRT